MEHHYQIKMVNRKTRTKYQMVLASQVLTTQPIIKTKQNQTQIKY